MSAVSSVSAEAASGLRAVFPETTVSAVPAAAGDFFRSGVPAAAASPASSAAVAALEPSADGRAAEILEKLAAGFRALGAYGVTFEVSSDEYTTRGRYAVEGENYYIAVGEAEVYCDGKIRYEIDNRRREVTIDDVDTSSRNLLSNPAHAFDFIGTQYAPSLVSDAEGRAVVRLTPTSADASPAGEILVTVDTARCAQNRSATITTASRSASPFSALPRSTRRSKPSPKGTTKVTNLSTSADTPARIYSGGYFPWIHLVDTNGVRM
ncbi:hypothetical protein [Alistipes finegoldii]|uniref:hypothetical protein n=1 Tax=Alistipes finegoldii TaxID=214856 RepID=UPI0039932172